MSKTELLTAWLRDAHSMEKALADFVKKSEKDFKGNEEAIHRLQQINESSEAAQAQLSKSLENMGESASGGKDFLGKAIGFITGTGSSLYKDDFVKDVLVLHGAFHFAHASYVSLAAAARSEGQHTLETLCEELAHEREAVATWAADMIEEVTDTALQNSK